MPLPLFGGIKMKQNPQYNAPKDFNIVFPAATMEFLGCHGKYDGYSFFYNGERRIMIVSSSFNEWFWIAESDTEWYFKNYPSEEDTKAYQHFFNLMTGQKSVNGCKKCGHEVKERSLFMSTFVGCLC